MLFGSISRGGIAPKEKFKYPNGYFKPKQCRRCGKTFIPEAPSQHYCSPACRGMNSYYIRNYGITEDEYEQMKKDQGFRCALCGGEGFVMDNGRNTHEKLVVDHDHTTGITRELLCHNCNRGLGLFKEDPAILRKAAAYIEKHREGATTIRKGVERKPRRSKRVAPNGSSRG